MKDGDRQMGTAEVLLEFKKNKQKQLMFHINAVIESNKRLYPNETSADPGPRQIKSKAWLEPEERDRTTRAGGQADKMQ